MLIPHNNLLNGESEVVVACRGKSRLVVIHLLMVTEIWDLSRWENTKGDLGDKIGIVATFQFVHILLSSIEPLALNPAARPISIR